MDAESSTQPSGASSERIFPATPVSSSSRSDSAIIGRQLGGDLPCVFCEYNLKGLSIRGLCPECGAAIRATILSVVDPQASILQPIVRPRLLAASLMAWTIGALGAALLFWWPYVVHAIIGAGAHVLVDLPLSPLMLLSVGVSGLGAAGLIRPHARIPRLHVRMAIVATMLYLPLGYALVAIANRNAVGILPGFLDAWSPATRDVWLTVSASTIVAAILLLLRPIVRLLVARSLLLRSGRVDRQTMLAMAMAALVLAAGQLIGRWAVVSPSMFGGVTHVLGLILMVTGAALLTMGLLGAVVDAVRIAQAILSPKRTIRQVVQRGLG